MRLIAAIPCYNAELTISDLVEQLLQENLDEIYVLDDASNDSSIETLKLYENKIHIVSGKKNLGPAGNRNRILPFIKAEDIVVFIDADMQLMSRNIRRIIEGLFKDNPHAAVIGGGIMTKDKKPMTYNYGIFTSMIKDAIGVGFERIAKILHFRLLALPLMPLARKFTMNVDILYNKPLHQRTDWVSEGHFYMRASVFKELKGFDPALKYHEGKEMMWRVRREAWGVLFAPRLWTRHMELKVRDKTEDELRKEYKPVVEKKVSMMLHNYEELDDPWEDEMKEETKDP